MINWIFIFLLVSLKAFSFNYTLNENFLSGSILEKIEVSSRVEDNGFMSLLPANQNTYPFLNLDLAFQNAGGNKFILIKFGLKPNENLANKLIKMNKTDWLIHLKTEMNQSDYAVYFIGFSKDELRELKFLPQKKSWASSLLLPKAYAIEPSQCQGQSQTKNQSFQRVSEVINENLVVKTISKCVANGIASVKNELNGVKDFFNQFAANPEILWQKTKEQFMAFKDLGSHLQTVIQNLKPTLAMLTSEELTLMACGMGAMLAKKLLLPGGVALMAVSLTQLVHKLSGLTSSLKFLSNSRFIEHRKKLMNEVLACE